MTSTDAGAPTAESTGGGEDNAVGATAASSDVGRSLIVDEAFFEEQFLRCQVCNEKFDQSERSPKSLPCNHTFCLPCLTQIFDHAQPSARRHLVWADESLDGTLKCPTCRVEIFLSRNKIKELPNDHRVVQMMDFLSQAVVKSKNVCTKHDRQPLNFFCKKCLVPVCRDCTVLDHKEADDHEIIDVSAALNENSSQFSDIENKSKQTLEKMKARSDALANASKRLDILERHLKSEIKETFIEYRLLLEKRQEALTNMVNQIIKDQKTLINARFVNVCEHGTQLQKLYDDFKSSRKSNDIQKLFTIQQEMTMNEVQFTEVASHDDVELFQSCEFEAQNEGSFLTDLSSLGEVRKKADPELREKVSQQQLVLLDMEEQRERQRAIDSEFLASHYTADCDDDLMPGVSANASIFFDNEDLDPPSADMRQRMQRPDPTDHFSRLISRYASMISDTADEEEPVPVPAGSRRVPSHRRGRRSRDTNSSQVNNSLSMQEGSDTLQLLRAVTGSNFSRPTGRSSHTHSSTPSGYRVVRHQTSSRPNFPTDDSS